MGFIDYETCEPLRIWNRLEPRSREVDFDEALAARVHDPLWMLSRQWQVGEFQGEDTGSAVLAKVAQRITPVASHQIGTAPQPQAEDGTLPAEARVEQLPIEFPAITRAQIGRTFVLMLGEASAAAVAAGTLAAPLDLAAYRARLRSDFGVAEDPAPTASDPVAGARARTAARSRRTTAALAGSAVDGRRIRSALALPSSQIPALLTGGLVAGHGPVLAAATARFVAWFDELYPAPDAGGAWSGAQLEYQATCSLPTSHGEVRLSLAEHASGRLDWWSYDQHSRSAATAATSTVRRHSVIPAPAQFAGMPNPRWWQFEDAAVDLGHFRAASTDLARIVVAEFALVYGNNWMVIPCNQQVGTLSEIDGVVVTDVFGQRTLVESAVGASNGSWSSWDLFSVSPRTASEASALGQHLFVPAALGQVIEADPHEVVTLVRDESANMVWGIERRVPDGLGGSEDAAEVARRFTDALQALTEPAAVPASAGTAAGATGTAADEDAPALRYVLGTTVAENWIPFVPVHTGADRRAIQLQRGSMPRFSATGAEIQRIRPRTTILRPGLTDADLSTADYFVHEEEVPRSGVTVSGKIRRTRWLGGRTVIWHGRTVTSGRGETDSGLRFDVVEPVSRD